jgi:hypothetical protein
VYYKSKAESRRADALLLQILLELQDDVDAGLLTLTEKRAAAP